MPLLIRLDIKVNFVTKPGVPGTPIKLKQPKTKRPDKTGYILPIPANLLKEVPPRTLPRKHTIVKIKPFVRPWFIKWAIEAVSPSTVETEIPIRMIPTCEMLEYANNFFISFSKYAANEPKKILINAKKKNMSSIIALPSKEFTFPTSNNILISRYRDTFVEIAEKKQVTKAGAYL